MHWVPAIAQDNPSMLIVAGLDSSGQFLLPIDTRSEQVLLLIADEVRKYWEVGTKLGSRCVRGRGR